ncbi:hypothetical protein L2E82_10351 [Cichorium intybus]|uniref:Uncharacterized protein n=1 Tax=Cichorium intybus TaxID=13427 RepID=A0ACB9GBI4_CICIN|nr:hypothetical protein L2E82_10351 [Cichorium intybus]
MAEQIGEQVENKKNQKLGSGRDTTDADGGIKKVDSYGGDGDGLGGKKINSDPSAGGSWGGEAFDGLPADKDLQFSDFINNIFVDRADPSIETNTQVPNYFGSESLDDLFSDLNFENLNFDSGETIDNDGKAADRNEVFDFSGQGAATRRIRLQVTGSVGEGSYCGLGTDEYWGNQDFGRDTSRLDYFSVAAFDVYGDDHLTGVASDGGGSGGGTRDRDVVVDTIPEQERGIATAVAGGGIRVRRVPVGISASDGGETVVQRDSGGGRRGCGVVVGPELEQERGSAVAGAFGGGDRTREVTGGIFANNDGGDGEVVVQRLKPEGLTLPVQVVVVVAVMMMVMLMVMVVLVAVMVKTEVRR